ncbi:MBL fold metallo-hydrolase [Streptomyces sp. NPDC057950]|uniref:MBL fold metallo-hydrolase n=1 Tax=Streptomyces sp. NPDC057950 TaxID=3346288 RepID=UPI0036E55AD6
MNAILTLPQGEGQDFDSGEVYFIGNATTLIRFAGFAILTDPAFLHRGDHLHLGHGIYARREMEPDCQVVDLPALDLIILSHYHADHFDHVAAQDLDKEIPVVSTKHAIEELRSLGFSNGSALDTWESQTVRKGDARLVVTAMPAEHTSDFEMADLLMPVNGNLLDFYNGDQRLFRLYISGDTMLHNRLHDVPRHYPDIDLGLFHAGGTTLFVTTVTMTGAQAVRCAEIVKPHTAIPIHYNDFSVFRSGLDDFKTAAAESSTPVRFHYLTHGDRYNFSPEQ